MAGVVDVTALGDGRFRVSDGASQCIAYAIQSGGQQWVFIEGMVYVIGAAGARGARPAQASDDDIALSAPMPATVAAINVAPGQQVEPGDVMITLEAMKMELAIRAPRQARVKSIACAKGDLVQPGARLLELE